MDPHREHCANCGAELSGRFCQECGQAAHLHRSLLHLGEELLHGVVHFDAKGWRTLPLLVARPGVLTRRYIDGMRTRYVSPLALFLFCAFLMYAVLSLTGQGPALPAMTQEQRAQLDAELRETLQEQRAAVAQARAQLERARARGDAGEVKEAQLELDSEQAALATASKTASILSETLGHGAATAASTEARPTFSAASPGTSSPSVAPGGRAGPATTGVAEGWQSQLSQRSVYTGSAWLDARLHRVLRNPELFLYKLKTTAYKWAFMLIPISLPLIWLMFIGRPGVAMYDHAVFSLYSLSFMALLFSAVMIAAALRIGWLVAWPLVLLPPLHMYLQLKGTYGLTRFAAAWRTLALLCIAGSAFALFLVLIAALAA